MSAQPKARALHWVYKIGDLKKSLDFYSKIFGLKVFRNEEFETGCEATCNGPYAGSWSKTMIGTTSEHENFALELTYNYGISSYSRGNDFRYIAVYAPDGAQKAKEAGYEVVEEKGNQFVTDPDGYRYRLVTSVSEEYKSIVSKEPFLYVCLSSQNVEQSKAYWVDVIGMTQFNSPSAGENSYDGDKYLIAGFAASQTKLKFVQLGETEKLDHAEAFGRIAFATSDIMPFYNAAVAKGDKIQNPPIKLSTPGKVTVEVTILKDRDDFEICFVEQVGFDDLCTTKPGDDLIDWEQREKKLSSIAKWKARKDKADAAAAAAAALAPTASS